MTRTHALTLSLVLSFCTLAGLVALLLVANASAAPADPSRAAEPAPLPRLYLPAVQQRMPAMSAEFTPAQPVATVTPDPPVTGDVQ